MKASMTFTSWSSLICLLSRCREYCNTCGIYPTNNVREWIWSKRNNIDSNTATDVDVERLAPYVSLREMIRIWHAVGWSDLCPIVSPWLRSLWLVQDWGWSEYIKITQVIQTNAWCRKGLEYFRHGWLEVRDWPGYRRNAQEALKEGQLEIGTPL